MARQFNGTSHSAVSAANVNLSPAGSGSISLSVLLWWDVNANDGDLALEHSINVDNNEGAFRLNPNHSGGAFEFLYHGGGGHNIFSFARLSAAAWHHYLLVLPTTGTAGEAYGDGNTLTVTPVQNNSSGSWGSFPLYLMSRAGSSLFGAGRMAELAIWAGDQSASAAALAGGISPFTIDPTNLLYLWHLGGTTSPEPEEKNGTPALTVTGAVFADDPPQLTRPPASYRGFPKARMRRAA